MMRNDFAAFILSHGRADRVFTYKTLKRCGYTGRIIIIIDDQDNQVAEYKRRYGDSVVVFNKAEVAKLVDHGDNFNDLRTTTHVRNAIFQEAKRLGLKAFVMLDDDYTGFYYKFNPRGCYGDWKIKDLDSVFQAAVGYLEGTPALSCLAFAQGGDFIGGASGSKAKAIQVMRKVMNSFICLTDRPFRFLSRLNEDVNTYVVGGKVGKLFLTTNQVALHQMETQTNAGGMSVAYLAGGTYVKSFYTVMYAPSCTKIMPMGAKHPRLHHRIDWRCAVPKILSEAQRKMTGYGCYD